MLNPHSPPLLLEGESVGRIVVEKFARGGLAGFVGGFVLFVVLIGGKTEGSRGDVAVIGSASVGACTFGFEFNEENLNVGAYGLTCWVMEGFEIPPGV